MILMNFQFLLLHNLIQSIFQSFSLFSKSNLLKLINFFSPSSFLSIHSCKSKSHQIARGTQTFYYATQLLFFLLSNECL